MPTYIKSGYWEKSLKAPKNHLDLERLIRENSSSVSLTNDQVSAISSANAPTALNPFATINDLPSGGSITDVTYAELVAAIGANELVPGSLYRITDFQTVHYMNDGNSGVIEVAGEKVINTGPIEPIIVLALSSNSLSRIAHSELYPQDVLWYDWNPDNWVYELTVGSMENVIVPGWKGIIYQREDTALAVTVGCDFRHVKNRRWKLSASQGGSAYSAETTYALGDRCFVTGQGLFISLRNGNTGNTPNNNYGGDYWWAKVVDYSLSQYVAPSISDTDDVSDYVDMYMFHNVSTGDMTDYENNVHKFFHEFSRDSTDIGIHDGTYMPNIVCFLPSIGSYSYYEVQIYGAFKAATFTYSAEDCILGGYSYNNIIGGISNSTVVKFSNSMVSFIENCNIGANFSGKGTSLYNTTIGNSVEDALFGQVFNSYIGNNAYEFTLPDQTTDSIFGPNFNRSHFECAGIKSCEFESNNAYIECSVVATPLQNTKFGQGVSGTSSVKLQLGTATHVFAAYNSEVVRATNNAFKLIYLKEDTGTFTQEIVDYNA